MVPPARRPLPPLVAAPLIAAGILGCPAQQQAVALPPVVDIAVPAGTAVAEAPGDDTPVAEEGMIWIPGGSFSMGSETCDNDERPVSVVAVRGFFLDATEVSTEAYQRCVSSGRCEGDRPDPTDGDEDASRCNLGKKERADHPVNCVTWRQADRYCRTSGKRLPTEREWEFAARGVTGRAFPWGEDWDQDRVCSNRKEGTCPIGSHRSGDTPSGLTDMAGNVWEWTADHYCPYETPECDDSGYVDRGGGWISEDPHLVHSAHRGRGEPDGWAAFLGFRCAKDR